MASPPPLVGWMPLRKRRPRRDRFGEGVGEEPETLIICLDDAPSRTQCRSNPVPSSSQEMLADRSERWYTVESEAEETVSYTASARKRTSSVSRRAFPVLEILLKRSG
jgi:hypothetical protein